MKRLAVALVLLFTLAGCSGKPISDEALGIMKARPFPSDTAVIRAAVQYLASHPAAGVPLHGIVFASFPHANSGHGECDTPNCWMVQLIGPDGVEMVVHADLPNPKQKVDIAAGHHVGYSLNNKALLEIASGHESFVCLERAAIKIA